MEPSHVSHTTSTAHSSNEPIIGVLLVHGLNGNLRDMEELERALQDRGMVTRNMLLPGHGVRVHEMLSTGWYQWADAVRDELYALKQRCDVVFIVGHSLGGALALHTAAHEEVAGIVGSGCSNLLGPPAQYHAGSMRKLTPPLSPMAGGGGEPRGP